VTEAVFVVATEVLELAGVERDGDAMTLEQIVVTALELASATGTNLLHYC
jgi:hypothetical protein